MSGFVKPAPDEVARHYDAAHQRIVRLVRTLSDEQLATAVAATPGWDVHDVLAHLSAITTDALSGRLSGLPSDDFTADQVRQRKDATVDELVAEWQRNLQPMLDGARTGLVRANLAVDAVTHEQDIRGAVGAHRVDDAAAVLFSLRLYAFGLDRKLTAGSRPALRVVATDGDFEVVAGDGEPQATLRATEFELFRALSGRRGRDDVLALDWTGDPVPYLDCLNVFGSVPDYAVSD